MEDTDIMPFGKHKGEFMANVPSDYLIWLHGELDRKDSLSEDQKNVKAYIEDIGIENL